MRTDGPWHSKRQWDSLLTLVFAALFGSFAGRSIISCMLAGWMYLFEAIQDKRIFVKTVVFSELRVCATR